MKVLVAIDGAECSQKVLDFLAKMSWNPADRFLILSIAETIDDDSDTTDSEEQSRREHLFQSCSKLADSAIEKLKTKLTDNNFEAKVVYGSPTEQIIECAQFWHADLIVVGSHGHSGCRKFLVGSVAERLIKQAPCTVQVVRHRDTARRSSVSIH